VLLVRCCVGDSRAEQTSWATLPHSGLALVIGLVGAIFGGRGLAKANKVKGAVVGVKDRVMGRASDAGAGLNSAQSSVSDAVGSAPDHVRSGTAGNPLAAGLIAFGVGWLAGSLVPSSTAEQDAATKVKDNPSAMPPRVADNSNGGPRSVNRSSADQHRQGRTKSAQ
jgi:hypothetical protein